MGVVDTMNYNSSWSITIRSTQGLQIGADFRDYKSGQERLQNGAALGITKRGKKITNRCSTNDDEATLTWNLS